MNRDQILAELIEERNKLDAAIRALNGGGPTPSPSPGPSPSPSKRKGGITAAGRRKLSAMMKKRWAERRAKTVASGKKK